MAAMSTVITIEWAPSSDPLAASPTWVDITQHFQTVHVSRGRGGVFDLYKVGELTLKARNGRRNEAPWMDVDTWYRWRQIRVRCTSTTDQHLFRGFITTTDHNVNDSPYLGTVTIRAVDKFGIVVGEHLNVSGVEGSDVYDDNGLVFASVDEFIDQYSVNFSTDTIDLYGGSDAPIHYIASSSTEAGVDVRRVEGNVYQLLQAGLEMEHGASFVQADGDIAINGRYSALNTLAGAAAFVLSDTPAAGEYSIQRGSLDVAPPGTNYFDAAVATGTSGNEKKVTATPAGYPETSFSRTRLPCNDDNWVEANAYLWTTLYKQTDTFPRAARLHLYPAVNFNLANAVQTATQNLGRAYCTIEHTPAGGSQKTWSALIEGVEHTITTETWQATLAFTSGDRWTAAYGSTGLFTLGTSSWGGAEILAP